MKVETLPPWLSSLSGDYVNVSVVYYVWQFRHYLYFFFSFFFVFIVFIPFLFAAN